MNLLARAIAIAAEAHVAQIDKAGVPYVLHPLRMMAQMSSDEERMTAVLHDVVEDSPWTFDQLIGEGIPEAVVSALRCVTKIGEDEDYTAFIHRAAANPIARRVKLADLADNMNMLRIDVLSDKDVVRLRKYHSHYQWLKQQP
jgi:(p)ppGpp synthase/HD superfamily hydrolase